MINLSPLELERLKFLLSGKALSSAEQLSTLTVLRSRFPDFLSNPVFKLTEENLKDNKFLIKFLTNSYNRNIIRSAIRGQLSLSTAQEMDLEQALSEKPAAVEGVAGQPTLQEGVPTTSQEIQPAGAAGSSPGGMPSGLPSIPVMRSFPRRVFQSSPLGGKEGGTGLGTAATNKINALEPEARAMPLNRPSSAGASGIRSASPRRFNFSGLRSKAAGIARAGMETANPYLKRAGSGLVNSLSGIVNPGGLGSGNPFSSIGRRFGRNDGGRGVFGRFSRGGGGGGGQPGISKISSGKKFALIGGAVFFLVFMTGLIGGLSGTTPTGQAEPLLTSNINSCKFTRSGASNLIKSSTLASFFTEVAAKTNVPAAALASLAMHETADFVTNADNTHSAFGSNIATATGCTSFATSPTGALGLMQIQPPKHIHDLLAASGAIPPFESVGAYSTQGVETGAGFIGKTADTLTLQDFCDVKTSIYLGAGVLISKNSGKPPATGDEVNKSVCGYYGSCVYGPYNYGLEAQQDFTNCQTTSAANPTAPGPIGFSMSCPLGTGFSISCGTAANPVNNCGHGGIGYASVCDPTYYACNGSKYSEALYHAIDVIGSNIVTLPFVNGNESVAWTKIDDQPIPIGGGSWGYRINYQANYKGKSLALDLTHLNYQINSAKTSQSGEQVGTVFAGVGHLHIGLSVDGRWVEPIQEARICAQ